MSRISVLVNCVDRLRLMKADLERMSAEGRENDRRALGGAIAELEKLVRTQIRESKERFRGGRTEA